jgi:hypothetical protein
MKRVPMRAVDIQSLVNDVSKEGGGKHSIYVEPLMQLSHRVLLYCCGLALDLVTGR